MIRLLTLALVGILGVTGFGYSQEIPVGVKEYMDQLQHDPTVEYGFDTAKVWRFIDQDIQFKDWHVGLPFQFYQVIMKKLETATVDTDFEDLIEPTDRWCIPIKIRNDNYVYHVLVHADNDKFKPAGCGEGVPGRRWNEFRKKFPEESGIIPGFIGNPFHLLYFPHIKNGKNVFHIKNPRQKDVMSKTKAEFLDNLAEGKTIIPIMKDIFDMHKGYRKRMEQRRKKLGKKPENLEDTSGGEK